MAKKSSNECDTGVQGLGELHRAQGEMIYGERDLELTAFLNSIKDEADRLQEEDGLSIDAAYERAVAAAIKAAAEMQEVSPIEKQVLAELKHASRGGRPVSSTKLAVLLGIDSRYTMAYHLRNLERRGLVYRPGGARSKRGWAAD